jgi:hypothetical protein
MKDGTVLCLVHKWQSRSMSLSDLSTLIFTLLLDSLSLHNHCMLNLHMYIRIYGVQQYQINILDTCTSEVNWITLKVPFAY